MSSGAEGIALLWKPLMWVLGGLFTVISLLVGAVWNANTKKVKKVSDDHEALSVKLLTDYMTKEQTEAMIEAYNRPLIEALKENTEAQKEVVKELRHLRENQIRAGIYD
jgi:preprotein translocase subunit SecG